MNIIVPAAGRVPNPILLVGEAPGREEASRGMPFVGRSGEEQEGYLSRHGLTARAWRRTNVIQEYTEGNPDPTVEQIERWTPELLSEIEECRPKLIIAVGRFAARWFLGEKATLDAVHGLVHRAGSFDEGRRDRAPQGCLVLPIIHPAAGFYDGESRASIAWDYDRVAEVVKRVQKGLPVEIREDKWKGREIYRDIAGKEVRSIIKGAEKIAIDTEGVPGAGWSIQISCEPGTGFTLRRSRKDFAEGIAALQEAVDAGVLIILHDASTPMGCLHDVNMCREFGLDLSRCRMWNTMYAAYLLRIESQGLKNLSYRWCGMEMEDYMSLIGDIGKEKQLNYLFSILDDVNILAPEARIKTSNDGTCKVYKPQHVHKTVKRIVTDHLTGKVNKDGEGTDLYERWNKIDKLVRKPVEQVHGLMPVGTLDDLPIEDAVYYASRDPDATFRLQIALERELQRLDLTRTMEDGMRVLPIFEECQRNGMPASRVYFQALYDEMTEEMSSLQCKISTKYFGGKPFNPKSSQQVAVLMRRRGLESEKTTSQGKMSTGKQSIEHLRFIDDAIRDVFEWREKQHIRDSFCTPVLERIPEGEDIYPVRCNLKVTRTATRRLASTNPNLLAIPSRTELGKRVRDGYRCKEGEVFGAWDLSAVEMRFMAHESGDKLMCQLFNEGRDIHSETAALIFGIDLDKVDKMKHRYPAKTAGFGILYGIQGPGLLTQLRMLGLKGWDVKAADKLIRGWLNVYGGVSRYIDRVAEEVRETGYVRDHWGMYRYLPGIWSDDRQVAAEAARHAVSHRIQGGAQGMIQRSMIWLRDKIQTLQEVGYNVQWSMQVHDELIFKFDRDLWEMMDELVIDALVNHGGIKLRIPVEAEGHMSETWGGLK